MDKTWRFWV